MTLAEFIQCLALPESQVTVTREEHGGILIEVFQRIRLGDGCLTSHRDSILIEHSEARVGALLEMRIDALVSDMNDARRKLEFPGIELNTEVRDETERR